MNARERIALGIGLNILQVEEMKDMIEALNKELSEVKEERAKQDENRQD